SLFRLRLTTAATALVQTGSTRIGCRLLVWNVEHLLDLKLFLILCNCFLPSLFVVDCYDDAQNDKQKCERRNHCSDHATRVGWLSAHHCRATLASQPG